MRLHLLHPMGTVFLRASDDTLLKMGMAGKVFQHFCYSGYEPTTRERTLRSVSKPYFVEGGHPSGRLVTRALLQFIRKSTEPNRLWHFEECFSLFNPALEEGTWLPALWCMVLSSLPKKGSART